MTKEDDAYETSGKLGAALLGNLLGEYQFRMTYFKAVIMSASFLLR